MILADTSVWIDHLRVGNDRLKHLLEAGEVSMHPFILGELACGHLHPRREILGLLRALPQVEILEFEEALAFLEARRLVARGLGWIDVNLLASAALASMGLWTLDRRLEGAAKAIGVSGP